MSDPIRSASCTCGAVELEISGEPAVQVFCHCDSCRGWLGAPIHAATLWPTPNVRVSRGAEKLGVFERTPASLRQFCGDCGSPVLIRHPALGLTDVPAGNLSGLDFQPTAHVHYGEKVLAVRDGLPKYRDLPEDFGGSGEALPES